MMKNYKKSIYIALSIIVVGIISVISLNISLSKNKIKTYDNKTYSLKYDKSWSLIAKENGKIVLKHGKEAKLNIEIISLKDETTYLSIDDLIDETVYNIEKQNKSYKLISKKETVVSKDEFKGYKLLYENEDHQVQTTLYKKSDKLIVFNYEADSNYFDILLDSVKNIIYNFNTKEREYVLSNKISVDTNAITYSEDKDLDELLDKNSSYEIADNNYYIKYSVPSNFEQSEFNSTNNMFHFNDISNKDLTISVSIYRQNIFQYLSKDDTVNVFYGYKMYQSGKDYSNFKETITKVDDADIYVYKNSYYYNKMISYDKDFNKVESKRSDENVQLIYALNKNHILVIKIEARGTAITKKLVDAIKIEETKNYSSYVTSEDENGFLTANLKRYSTYDKKSIDEITIRIPNEYKESDRNNNVFSNRYFGLNYNEENYIYDYEIRYELTSNFADITSKIDAINSSFSKAYGEYNYLTYSSDLTVNAKKFSVYTGGYTQLGGIMFTNVNRFKFYTNKKVLLYELTNGGYLLIDISGNGKDITDDILTDATNFSIKQIDK